MTKHLTILFLLLTPSLAFTQFLSEEETPVIVKREAPTIIEGSSEYNRMGKKYEIAYSPYGSGPVPGLNTSLSAGLYLTRNMAIILNHSKVNVGNIICSGDISCSQAGQSIGAYFRHFTMNSFYYSIGFDQRHVEFKETDLYSNSSYGFNGDTTALGILIGNQWQWENFILGCDWIGFSIPLIYKYQYTDSSTAPTSSIDPLNSLVKNVAGMGLRFRIGMAF